MPKFDPNQKVATMLKEIHAALTNVKQVTCIAFRDAKLGLTQRGADSFAFGGTDA
jgi:hypothetical protein